MPNNIICYKCRQLNLIGSLNCANCKTALSEAVSDYNPFGDIKPAWMQNDHQTSSTPAYPSANATNTSSGLGFSIEDLLQASPPATPALSSGGTLSIDDLLSAKSPPPPPPPIAPPVSTAYAAPAWNSQPFANSQASPPPFGQFNGSQTFIPAPVEEAKDKSVYQFDRGYFTTTDEYDVPLVYATAGFGRRLGGAIVDSIVASLLTTVFSLTIGGFILGFFVPDSATLRSISNSRDYNKVLPQAADILVTLKIVEGLLTMLVSLLYYTLMVGIMGRTIGHLVVGVKVFTIDGRPAGFLPAIVRALYGSLPGIVGMILMPSIFSGIIFAILFNSGDALANVGLTLLGILVVNLLALVGFLWIIWDKHKQGWHDKLAGTYVVHMRPI